MNIKKYFVGVNLAVLTQNANFLFIQYLIVSYYYTGTNFSDFSDFVIIAKFCPRLSTVWVNLVRIAKISIIKADHFYASVRMRKRGIRKCVCVCLCRLLQLAAP